jgi:hypothetical protein
LADGEQVILPGDSEGLTHGSPVPGTLLLADPSAEEPWYIWLRRSDDCFLLYTGLYEERGRNLVTQEGLVLPMRDFVGPPTGDDGRYDSDRGVGICVDEKGRAFSAR